METLPKKLPEATEITYSRSTVRARRLRAEVIAKLGSKCRRCGITDIRVLQIDHIHGGGVRLGKTKSTIKHYADILQKRGWLPRVQLLCANCNWIKRHENQEFPIAVPIENKKSKRVKFKIP